MTTTELSLIDELDRVEAKAEIIDGKIVVFPMSGRMPTFAAEQIHASLGECVQRTKRGEACAGGNDFLVQLPRRQSSRPDASYYVGPDPGMKFFPQAPLFAVEVRSEHDNGPAAEREMASKRADYFDADTLGVWDVDLLSEDVVRVFRGHESAQPAAIYRRGQTAEAEPAVPNWTMAVDELFRP